MGFWGGGLLKLLQRAETKEAEARPLGHCFTFSYQKRITRKREGKTLALMTQEKRRLREEGKLES